MRKKFVRTQCRALVAALTHRCTRNAHVGKDVCWQHGGHWYAGMRQREIVLVEATMAEKQADQLRGLKMMQEERDHRHMLRDYTYVHFNGPNMQWSTIHDETGGRAGKKP